MPSLERQSFGLMETELKRLEQILASLLVQYRGILAPNDWRVIELRKHLKRGKAYCANLSAFLRTGGGA